jgi:RNA polymerase sigma-70 factor, ECF subfamily
LNDGELTDKFRYGACVARDEQRDASVEAQFLARLVARDEAAFNELMELYQRRVFLLAQRMLGRKAEAEELTQEVFVKVFRSIDSFRGDAKLATWIFRVTVNLCKNRLKYNARRSSKQRDELEKLGDHTSLSAAEGVSSGSVARPDELAHGRELERVVKQALFRLDPEFRQLVVLRDIEGLSYDEIAQVTQLRTGTVKSRIHRGRSQLRAHVEALLHGPSKESKKR